jgi:hypothetical protein
MVQRKKNLLYMHFSDIAEVFVIVNNGCLYTAAIASPTGTGVRTS